MFDPVSTYRIQFHGQFTFSDFETHFPYLARLGIKTIYASPIFESVPGSVHGYDGTDPHRINPEIGAEGQLARIHQKLQKHQMAWIQDIAPNHMAFHHGNSWLMDVLEHGRDSQFAPFFDIDWNAPGENGRIMAPFLGTTLDEALEKSNLALTCQGGRFFLKYFEYCFPVDEQSIEPFLPHNRSTEAFLEEISQDRTLLKKIADSQHYRLCHWQESNHKLNYRRFFTINSLICLRMEDRKVFDYYHEYIKYLLDKDLFQGLRIDHIDGLYDPGNYLQWLRELAGENKYLVVEKILQPTENLPKKWPVQGTTGYDFLGTVNSVFTDGSQEQRFTKPYGQFQPDKAAFEKQLHAKKAHILGQHMGGELKNLLRLFRESFPAEFASVDRQNMEMAIGAFLVHCPVYRFYGHRIPLDKDEAQRVRNILAGIRQLHPTDHWLMAVDTLEKIFLHSDTEDSGKAAHLFQRCMQYSGPLTAKGVEDTLMYTYNRFIGLNEVGSSPSIFGISAGEFHEKMQDRQRHFPLAMNATSTHDTKRGEDVRARLSVLTTLAAEWADIVLEWQQLNADLKKDKMPDGNDEYFIYQTLVGAFPPNPKEKEDFKERLSEYLPKALREAKVHSGWEQTNEEYEKATIAFAEQLLDENRPFWKSFAAFQKVIAHFGAFQSLAQVLLKCTCPGIPDFYQGTELWDFSLVDPDNRRAVDYDKRAILLQEIRRGLDPGHWKNPGEKAKLWLVHTLLGERMENPEIFAKGLYVPLKAKGTFKKNILAFARRYGKSWVVMAVPLHLARLCREQNCEPAQLDWQNTRIELPVGAPAQWTHLLEETEIEGRGEIRLSPLFGKMPLAMLRSSKTKNGRGAGVFLSVTSLPSAFGLGDMGPEARNFADFLSRSRQSCWHVLPLNPTDAGSGNSPYSSSSSMAGNTWLISLEMLVEAGLLDPGEVQKNALPPSDKADYSGAVALKEYFFEQAWRNFCSAENRILHKRFEVFCEKEDHWLDDYALYVVLKSTQGKPWFEWPAAYVQRDPGTLEAFQKKHAEAVLKTKWLQFIFHQQWHSLREYCNQRGIGLLGDLPFYVSHDSADVWSHRDIFNLDSEGRIAGSAGVPPDYFSETGQLWHMPTFCWEKLKESKYHWWVCRIRKNLELFDLLRLDHFRAFDAFWEVAAGETDAVNGTWKRGPGLDFFRILKQELGGLPFVAEDLGGNMEGAYQLRDAAGIPGMKVLQFAFGDEMPNPADLPHHYKRKSYIYTGTHDNNTTAGWFGQEAGRKGRDRLETYTGIKVTKKTAPKVLARLAYSSLARMVILPMQDILGLDETKRMNTPGTSEGNWLWRLLPGQTDRKTEAWLREWTEVFGR